MCRMAAFDVVDRTAVTKKLLYIEYLNRTQFIARLPIRLLHHKKTLSNAKSARGYGSHALQMSASLD